LEARGIESGPDDADVFQMILQEIGGFVTTHEIKHVLLWCVGLNYLVLLAWSGVFILAHDWMFRLHSRWFRLSIETFDAIQYAGIAVYKIGIILFNLVPLIALCLAS
jgi:hypothetical protein